jgi:isoquinoline 1-oxidoreductase beta subunit
MAIRTSWVPLRMAGAQAREMLAAAAAQKWGVNASQCRAENGFVVNTGNNSRLSYGSLAADAAKLPVPANVTLKDPKQFRVIGKPVKRLDTRDKVTGRAQFGLDTRLPGMVYAVIERCPVFGGKVVSFDATKTKAVPGVKDVIRLSAGVAVVADSTWAAMQGRKVLQVQWDEGAGASTSSASIGRMLADRIREPGAAARKEGDASTGLAKAAKKIEAVYEVPFLSHAPMEPMNCTVQVHVDGADMWIGTQSPTSSRALAAETIGIPPEKVNFHGTMMGGGFGRRGEGEMNHVSDTAELGKALMGTPV